MDISAIKPPVEKTEGEPHAAPGGSESAFLQLLASLGLTPPIRIDAGQRPAVHDGAVVQIESLSVDTETLARALAAHGLQEKIVAVENANGGGMPDGTKPPALLAQAITSAGATADDPTGIDSTQALSVSTKGMPMKDQAVATEGKLPLLETALSGVLPPATPKDEPQAGPTQLMEVVLSGHAPKERGSASAASQTFTSFTPNVASQPSVSFETPAKQGAMAVPSLAWNAGMELSTLQQSGTESNPGSAEHDGSKERFTQAEADGGQPTLAPVISSLNSQSVSTPVRTTAATVVEAPTVAAHPESPLPASVRFEVQQGDMGRIRVHLSVVDHTVYTNVMTERVEAHDFLVKGSERYEAGLAAHGLDVGRFQVDVQGQSREHADRGGAAWSQGQTPRHRAEPSNNADNSASEWQAEERKVGWENRMVNVFA